MNKFYIPKLEGDYSDILLTRGVAELVKLVLNVSGKKADIFIGNLGQFYVIESNEKISKYDFNSVTFKALYPLIYYEKMDKPPNYVSGENLIDYTVEEKYEDWSSAKRKSTLIRQTTGVPLSNRIMDDIYVIKDFFKDILFTILEFYSEIHKDYEELDNRLNQLIEEIQLLKFKEKILEGLREKEVKIFEDFFKQFNNYHWNIRKKVKNFLDEKKLSAHYSAEMIKEYYEECKIKINKNHNALSCLLPGRVKGVNSADVSASISISPKNISESWSKLYLILIGFYKSLVLKTLSSGNKLYSVVEPNRVHLESFDNLYKKIEPIYYPADTLEKQNILYLCDFIITILDRLEEFNQLQSAHSRKNRVKDFINGLKNVYLVDMGQNHVIHVIKNIYDLNIPNWLLLTQDKEKDEFKLLFQEFIDLIQPINDKMEDIKLFQELYAFLTTEKTEHLLNYYYYHAVLVMQRLANNTKARNYTKRSVEFIMGKLENQSSIKYSGILNNQGFKNFAKAIRNSTLVPIYLNEKKSVKFGLLQEIRRAALNKNTLLMRLSEFMANYNNENGLEAFRQGKQKRANLTTVDFEDIVRLIDDYDSKIIGNMLLAYGFAKDEKVDVIIDKEEEING